MASKKRSSKSKLGSDVYSVERIVNRRVGPNGRIEYYVKWAGWSSKDNTWEPESNILDDRLIQNFEASLASSQQKGRPAARKAKGKQRNVSKASASQQETEEEEDEHNSVSTSEPQQLAEEAADAAAYDDAATTVSESLAETRSMLDEEFEPKEATPATNADSEQLHASAGIASSSQKNASARSAQMSRSNSRDSSCADPSKQPPLKRRLSDPTHTSSICSSNKKHQSNGQPQQQPQQAQQGPSASSNRSSRRPSADSIEQNAVNNLCHLVKAFDQNSPESSETLIIKKIVDNPNAAMSNSNGSGRSPPSSGFASFGSSKKLSAASDAIESRLRELNSQSNDLAAFDKRPAQQRLASVPSLGGNMLLAGSNGFKWSKLKKKQHHLDQIVITDVTANNTTITVRECKSFKLFQREHNLKKNFAAVARLN